MASALGSRGARARGARRARARRARAGREARRGEAQAWRGHGENVSCCVVVIGAAHMNEYIDLWFFFEMCVYMFDIGFYCVSK